MNTPFIPRTSARFMPPGKHDRGSRQTGGHGSRKLTTLERGKELMARWGIPIPTPEPCKHWNAARLARAGLRKFRAIEGGKRVTRLIPIEG
jgi:hypothetical protein